jgi:hypothetical protein
VRPRTLTTLAKHRLHSAAFALQADVLLYRVWKQDPDLAVLRCRPLGRDERDREFAMGLLDRLIAELRTHCEATGRALVVTGSPTADEEGALLVLGLEVPADEASGTDLASMVLGHLGVDRPAAPARA